MNTILEQEIKRFRELLLSEDMVQSEAYKSLKETLDTLKKKKKVLLMLLKN